MTSVQMSKRSLRFSNLGIGGLAEVEPLHFTNPSLLNRDLARVLVSTSEPPCCLRRLQSAAANTMAVLTTPNVAPSEMTYSLT